MSSFVQTIFYGKEVTLFIFDLLVFLFVDFFAQNYILAGFVLYVVSKVRLPRRQLWLLD